MLKKVLSFVLVGFLFSAAGVRLAYAGPKEEKETRFALKVKEGISKLEPANRRGSKLSYGIKQN